MHKYSGGGAPPGTPQPACASCKHQRKKCDEKCVLAPLFPPERAREFQAVHKAFGVSNVQKIVKSLSSDEERRRAADSLVWEALCRQRDPVLGSYGEYKKVYEELKRFKAHAGPHIAEAVAAAGSAQGAVGYKPAPAAAAVGWSHGGSVLNGLIHQQNSSVVADGSVYTFASQQHMHDRGVAVAAPQQHLVNGFHHQYYLSSGQFSPVDVKSMESTIWEAGS